MEILSVFFILIVIVAIILYFDAKYSNANQSKIEEKQQLQKNKIQDKIQDFVKACIDETVKFPSFFTIKEDYIKALRQVIKNEKNISVDLGLLQELLNKEIKLQIISIFKKSFLELNPNLKHSLVLEHWVNAYVDTFENNFNYINEFVEVLKQVLQHVGIPINYSKEFEDYWKECKYIYAKELKPSKNQFLMLDKFGEASKAIKQDFKDYFDSDKKPLIFIYELITKIIEKRSELKLVETVSVALKKGEKLVTQNETTINDVDAMTGIQFEQFLCGLFAENGYKTQITKASGDQGADLIIEKFGERTVVQAKCYSGAVSNSAIQEVVAAKAHYNCSKAMVVTNSYFTKSAMELAGSNNVELWDREILTEKLKYYQYRQDAETSSP